MKNSYIEESIIQRFANKGKPFNYKKLVRLLIELNNDYSRKNTYSSAAILRAILDHIPPLLGHGSFESIINYHWGQSHQKYIRDLIDFKTFAHDALHTQISNKEDHLSFDELPARIKINTLLEECVTNGGISLLKNNAAAKGNKIQESQIQVTLAEEKATWGNFSIGNYKMWDCFRIVLYIDNFKSSKNDYISVSLIATSNEGIWLADRFVFVYGSNETANIKEKIDFEVGAGKRETVSVFISDYNFGSADRRSMPDFDRDKLYLKVKTASGKEFSLYIKPGWIH